MQQDQPDYIQKKLIRRSNLGELVSGIRKRGLTIATVNGSFDLLHAGHLHIIHEASKQGDVLIVALNTDASIKRYKGENRPIVPLEYRLQMMCALGFVDYVTAFDEDDPRELLEIVRPDVHVNGPEWGENCIESSVVKKHGGKMHIIKKVDGLSTSKIIEKIIEITSHVQI